MVHSMRASGGLKSALFHRLSQAQRSAAPAFPSRSSQLLRGFSVVPNQTGTDKEFQRAWMHTILKVGVGVSAGIGLAASGAFSFSQCEQQASAGQTKVTIPYLNVQHA